MSTLCSPPEPPHPPPHHREGISLHGDPSLLSHYSCSFTVVVGLILPCAFTIIIKPMDKVSPWHILLHRNNAKQLCSPSRVLTSDETPTNDDYWLYWIPLLLVQLIISYLAASSSPPPHIRPTITRANNTAIIVHLCAHFQHFFFFCCSSCVDPSFAHFI